MCGYVDGLAALLHPETGPSASGNGRCAWARAHRHAPTSRLLSLSLRALKLLPRSPSLVAAPVRVYSICLGRFSTPLAIARRRIRTAAAQAREMPALLRRGPSARDAQTVIEFVPRRRFDGRSRLTPEDGPNSRIYRRLGRADRPAAQKRGADRRRRCCDRSYPSRRSGQSGLEPRHCR